ncbi:CMRF35-like molecule 8 [Acipenser ruthenus]|uniref:CMRF35-like molecule 8 n=1 Tax=Acipenser ruthenus TaxID=7906 RepID=UPI00274257DE|nr:CMRF35-like molecule 8 [Acipenser ruthenus]
MADLEALVRVIMNATAAQQNLAAIQQETNRLQNEQIQEAKKERVAILQRMEELVSTPAPSAATASIRSTHVLNKMTNGDDIEAYLLAFERTAIREGWPRVQWAVLGSVKSAEIFYGIEGGNVKIDCPYQPEYNENEKYLCHTRWILNNALISSGEPETKGRFSLYDNRSARVFTVTITELTLEDAGTYYCGIDNKINVDEYTEVKVIVNKAPKTPPTTTRATRSSTIPSTTTVKGNTDNGQTRDCTSSSPAADTHSEATAKAATEEKITEKAPVERGWCLRESKGPA